MKHKYKEGVQITLFFTSSMAPTPKLILRRAFQHTNHRKYPLQKKATVPIMFFYMYSISRMHRKKIASWYLGVFCFFGPWITPPLVKLRHFAKNYCIYLWQKTIIIHVNINIPLWNWQHWCKFCQGLHWKQKFTKK